MFKKLKEKLKSWTSKSEEKVEGKAEAKKEIEQAEKDGKSKQKTKRDKEQGNLKEKAEKKSKWQKLKSKFKFKISEDIFEDIFEDLEMILLQNNVALEAIDKIRENLKKELVGKEIKKKNVEEKIKKALKKAIQDLLVKPFDLMEKIEEKLDGDERPYIIAFFGVNGSGKTTTIAKLASKLKKNNLKMVLAACDTFRAASIEQLEKHANNLGVKIIKGEYGSDPTSIAYDAIKHAESKNKDVVLIDTAGRMHTDKSLMEEMKKIIRVNGPDLKIFVAESITGNDAIEQARNFNEAVGIDASILTKADIDEKGGTAISISHITKKPILYLGMGQEYNQLEKFNTKKLIRELGL